MGIRNKATNNIKSAKLVAFALCTVLFVLCTAAVAQQVSKIPTIGFLVPGSPSGFSARVEAFRQGLRELGYVEGKSVAIEYRWAEGKLDRLPELAAELVRIKVDAIVTSGDAAIRAAKERTTTIPIVVAVAGDLLGPRYVTSHARPGGNITGLLDISPELSTKRLELVKECFPRVSRVAILLNGANPVMVLNFKETESAARSMGLIPESIEVRNSDDFDGALRAAIRGQAGVLIVLQDSLVIANTQRIIEFAAKHRLPAMYFDSRWIETGGLMSYGPNYPDLFRRAAGYVDKILKGRKPSDLPVEQPKKFEFVINLKAAKQIGLIIPPNVLARADRVIR
jgi:putative tryptophan/tyrosine transport system substrate-binding protein